MKIDKLKINGFGKLKNKEVDLFEGINVIYGENESGKSSLLKFISSMLYGLSKNKNGKEIPDFDRYKPWINDEFSGKIAYTLDNGESYEVYREFKKRNPVIYNSRKEDISKEFTIDKTKGIDFFVEQTGIDEETFYNTAITEQEGIKLSKSSQNSIIQKISNLVSTGDDNVSYKKTLDKINKRLNEEVGTERTSQKPINVVENKIRRLIQEKRALEIYKEGMYDNSAQKEDLREEERVETYEKSFLKELKANQDANKIKEAEINFNRKLEDEYNQKIKELNSRIDKADYSQNEEKISLKNYFIAIIILCIIFAILMVFNPNKLINLLLVIPIVLIAIKARIDKEKFIKNQKNNDENKYQKIESEIEILRENKEKQKREAEEKEILLDQEIDKENRELIEKYEKYISKEFMEEALSMDIYEVAREIDQKENRINTIKFKLQSMENDTKVVNEKLEDLSKIEEELQGAEEEKEELMHLSRSYNIAKDCMMRAYEQMKENISPRFTQNLCDIISKVSDGRYKNVVLTDDEGLNVEIQNGSYVPAYRLSTGTIDQMYLSLRLSALNELSGESLPIILDEAFAYFDDERLANVLKYLKTNFESNQIILFTCSKREIELLERLNIEYNVINLEK